MSEKIGMRIRERRKELGFTQPHLAAMLPSREDPSKSISAQAISNWENGREIVPEDRYIEIAEALKCDVGDLFGGMPVTDSEESRLAYVRALHASDIGVGARDLLVRLATTKDLCRVHRDGGLTFTGSLGDLAASSPYLTLEQVQAVWPECLASPFLERKSSAEWDVGLVFP